MGEQDQNRRKRLLYRAMHRGFKEADIVIGGFAEQHIFSMSADELDEFEAIIAFPDKELYEWLVGRAEPPANLSGPVFERMQGFDAVATIARRANP